MKFEANSGDGGKWCKVTFELKDDGTWTSEERSGFDVGHARGSSVAEGAGTWVKEAGQIVFTVTSFKGSNSDARARKADRVGETITRSAEEVLETKQFTSLFFKELLYEPEPRHNQEAICAYL
eukprot:g21701.t1